MTADVLEGFTVDPCMRHCRQVPKQWDAARCRETFTDCICVDGHGLSMPQEPFGVACSRTVGLSKLTALPSCPGQFLFIVLALVLQVAHVRLILRRYQRDFSVCPRNKHWLAFTIFCHLPPPRVDGPMSYDCDHDNLQQRISCRYPVQSFPLLSEPRSKAPRGWQCLTCDVRETPLVHDPFGSIEKLRPSPDLCQPHVGK